jgi:hypothetical protein
LLYKYLYGKYNLIPSLGFGCECENQPIYTKQYIFTLY